jgi:hypothetical protein
VDVKNQKNGKSPFEGKNLDASWVNKIHLSSHFNWQLTQTAKYY